MKASTSAETLTAKLAERATRVAQLAAFPARISGNKLLLDGEVTAFGRGERDPDDTSLISKLLTLETILPRMVENRARELQEFDAALLDDANKVIQQDLGPRVRALAAKVRAKITADLRPHVSDPYALEIAVSRSDVILKVEGLAWSVNSTPHDLVTHVRGVLNSIRAVEEGEKKFS